MRRAHRSLQVLAALVLPALVGSCENDTTGPAPPPPPPPLLIVADDVGAQSQNLTITRGGVGVTDATVTINGVAILHVVAGLYHGQLPTAVPAGSPLNLQVSAGGTTVQGTVNVPEAPVLTAPVAEAVFDPRDTISFSWTSATDPDRFVVSMGLITPVGGRLDMTFPVAGTARELEISLPPEFGAWAGSGTTYSVFAYNDGSFTGQVHPDSRMTVGSEDAPKAGITTEPVPLLILGDMGTQLEKLTVTREGVAVTDATVTINGVAIPHVVAGLYQGQLPTAVPAGSPLNLEVSAGGATVQGTVNVPEAPVLTAPAAGAVFDPRDTITFSWTSATDPDRFVVSMGLITPNGSRLDIPFPAAGTTRELEIPLPPEFGAGPGTTYSVFAYNDGSFTGQVDPESRIGVGSDGSPNAGIITAAYTLRLLGGPAHPDSRREITSVGNPRVITINR